MELTDTELVRLSKRGDREAFRELVERYQRRVLTMAVGMLHNRDDALEVVQDTFVKAFWGIRQFKGESSFYTWLSRIAVNRCIDYQRRERRWAPVSGGGAESNTEISALLPDDGVTADPFARARDREIHDRIIRAVAELTPDHKAVILLREVEGLSYEDISKIMRCSKGTVMSRLHYARKKLQGKLKDLL